MVTQQHPTIFDDFLLMVLFPWLEGHLPGLAALLAEPYHRRAGFLPLRRAVLPSRSHNVAH